MNLAKDFSNNIIEPLEIEIKNVKRKINKKLKLTREINKNQLQLLQNLLIKDYQIFYKLQQLEKVL